MRRVVFIGGYDKSDLIIYLSKIVSILGHKVLFIDTTLMQKTRYIVPTMSPAQKYVTTYDGIDIAVGFESMNDLKDYFSVAELKYDYVFVDVDSRVSYLNFGLNQIDKHFFVTSFDVFSIQRGMDVLKAFRVPTIVNKVIFTKNPESEEKEYLDFISMSFKVKWDDYVVYFPFETNDLYAIYQNQRFSRIRFDNLSLEYMDGLYDLVERATELNRGEIKKAIKLINRS